MWRNYLITGAVLIGLLSWFGSPGQSLESYGKHLVRASCPGPYTLAFMDVQKDLSPEIRLGNFLRFLDKTWVYVPDKPGQDRAAAAETIFRSCLFKGDCDDLAVVIVAFCRGLGLQCCFILGERQGHGHVWTGVKVTPSGSVSTELLNKLETVNGFQSDVIYRPDGCFFQLIPQKAASQYRATHMVTILPKPEIFPLP